MAVSDDAQAERLIRELRQRSWRIDKLVEQEATHRLATVRLLGHADSTPVVDLRFASSGLEPKIVAAADVLEVFPAQRIPVAVVGHLIALKLLARDENRPQDDMDLRALVAVAEDVATARFAVGLIQRRGFARRRDLQAALANLVNR